MLRTAVGGVRAVCDKGCSKSCGTAGHQTLPAARQSLADQADSSCSACSVAETRRLVGHRSISQPVVGFEKRIENGQLFSRKTLALKTF